MCDTFLPAQEGRTFHHQRVNTDCKRTVTSGSPPEALQAGVGGCASRPPCSLRKEENAVRWGQAICPRSPSKSVKLTLFQYAFHQTMLDLKGHGYALVSKSELHFGVRNQVTNGETVFGCHAVELGRNSPVSASGRTRGKT